MKSIPEKLWGLLQINEDFKRDAEELLRIAGELKDTHEFLKRRPCQELGFARLAFECMLRAKHVLSAVPRTSRVIRSKHNWRALPKYFRNRFAHDARGWLGLEITPTLEIVNVKRLADGASEVFKLAGQLEPTALRFKIQRRLLPLCFALARLARKRKVFALPDVVYYESRIADRSDSKAKNPIEITIASQLKSHLKFVRHSKSNQVIKGSLLGTDAQWKYFDMWKKHGKYDLPGVKAGTVFKAVSAIRKLSRDVYPVWKIPLQHLTLPGPPSTE
jgi:hypothetical protein